MAIIPSGSPGGKKCIWSFMTNLWAELIETLKADPLCKWYTGDTSRLGAGYVVEASWEKILRYLGGFPAASVPCHHDHGVKSHQLHYPVPVLVDGQVLLLSAELCQFAKTLSLTEVQEVQESQAAVRDLLAARAWGPLSASVLRLPQPLLHIPGAHRHVDPVASIILLREAKVYLSSPRPPPVSLFFSALLSAGSRHVSLCFKPLEAVKESPELLVLRAAGLDVVMLAEKDLVQLGSTLRTVPVPAPALSPPVGIHIYCKLRDVYVLHKYIFMFTGLQTCSSLITLLPLNWTNTAS